MRNFIFGVVAGIGLLVLLAGVVSFSSKSSAPPLPPIAYSDFIQDVDAGRVRGITIHGPLLTGTLQEGKAFQTYMPDDPALVGRLLDKGVRVAAGPVEAEDTTSRYLLSWLPLLVLCGSTFWVVNRIARALSFITKAFEALAARMDRGGPSP